MKGCPWPVATEPGGNLFEPEDRAALKGKGAGRGIDVLNDVRISHLEQVVRAPLERHERREATRPRARRLRATSCIGVMSPYPPPERHVQAERPVRGGGCVWKFADNPRCAAEVVGLGSIPANFRRPSTGCGRRA